MTTILTMQREPSKGGATLSKLYFQGVHVCDILEDEVREIPGVPVAEWKEKGRTAIPADTYKLSLQMSSRFGPDTLTVDDVPGFQYIRIHGGNTQFDTEGCLLPGNRNTPNTVAHSRVALSSLRNIVVPKIMAGEDVWLEILPALTTV
jgi:hypothetical protein